ncbi:hypothetical protein Tsubulata_048058 [Turnera subulata]|uniref:Pentacotripeptide-repeat region of PRORP domain-containing protein n=1 Tax=Turnera subulata TaxID=218843 RepID=A0A9Q0GAP7_9ROSI|nr:hypothetical protein Tsubulata_048058 [Turnera subulata]
MSTIVQTLKTIIRRHNIYPEFTPFGILTIPTTPNPSLLLHILNITNPLNPSQFKAFRSLHSLPETDQDPETELAIKLQNTLKTFRDSATRKIELALGYCCPTVTESLAFNVLRRHRSDWKSAYVFFNWVVKEGEISPGSDIYNELLDILGRTRRFDELNQVLDEMSKRAGLVNEETFGVLLNRYAAAHKVEEAIGIFERRKQFGLELDLVAFQKLLMSLCRHKHVEVAETLLHTMGRKFGVDIKTMNIILNGWCVLGNVHEAKRFWKDIIQSKFKPDLFTYGTFIKALTKKGKLGTAMKLYRAMWEGRCKPDVVICNCVIDALCFKKRIPEALEVFEEIKERGCAPNAATYNSLIKYLCKIRRMDKVYELLDEMEAMKGSCMPTDITFNFLLKSLMTADEVDGVLERMKRNGCEMNGDVYNLILKLYVNWDCDEKVRYIWDEMEKNGMGPDSRSYTVMIHGLHDKGRIESSLRYFGEMTSKGMVPEPRTEILANDMNVKLKEGTKSNV